MHLQLFRDRPRRGAVEYEDVMAGATNRALKAAGIPKATIATLRVEHGSGLSLRSALGIAHERGLPVGKAAEFHAAREAKHAASPAGQAAAADFRAKAAAALRAAGERKTAMLAERQKRVAGTVRALGKGMLAQRKAAAVPKLPALTGTEKQVAWAAKMRETAIATAAEAAKRDPDLWKDTLRVFRSIRNAKTWIDNGRNARDHAYNVRNMADAENIAFD